jgi:TonB family protein
MSEEKIYRIYTASDIEKYHKGLLSPKEMNEMERVALDDPFLADAMEGYGNVNTNLSADIEELEKKLEQRVSEGKLVRMAPRFNIYKLLKIAAVVVIVAGSSLLIYQLGFNNSKKSLAKEEINVPQQTETKTTVAPVGADSIIKQGTVNIDKLANGNSKKVDTISMSADATSLFLMSAPKDSLGTTHFAISPAQTENAKTKITEPVVNNNKEFKSLNKQTQPERDKDQFGDFISADSIRPSFRKDADNLSNVGVNQNAFYSKAKTANVSNNYFNGRIVDGYSNAVPFANVTNIRDNVGTYADANGYFTLISPDTALNLRIKSVGFESDTVRFLGNTTSQFLGNTTSNQVTLKEDKMNGLVVLGGKRVGKNPNPDANIKVEEPEPADGWSNYSLYLANNLKVPDEIKRKDVTGEVKLSFEINKLGEPVNIKIEKSLCKECDEEAIRLIKQGPKWKPKKKKNKVTVNVPFEITE